MSDRLSSVICEIAAVQAQPFQTATPADPGPTATPAGERLQPFLCTDVRLDFVEVECLPVPIKRDRGKVVIAVRDTEDRFGVAAWLTREDAQALADYINRVLA